MALTDDQRRFLEDLHFAVLGTVNRSGSPHLTVMWYLLDGDEILFNTVVGRAKESNLERDPRVSLLVYDATGYEYIRIDGRARAIDDPAVGQADIRRLAMRYYRDDARVERAVRERWSKERRVSYRVPTTRVYDYR
ncbi:MAG TPA: PPOX class F420-dependent oxidoreductase [Candidatus Limnocylindria bacterium]|nr:PPOX class F420-dependent oxidoreductase [Candidatus Limnocylindria bacterium]